MRKRATIERRLRAIIDATPLPGFDGDIERMGRWLGRHFGFGMGRNEVAPATDVRGHVETHIGVPGLVGPE